MEPEPAKTQLRIQSQCSNEMKALLLQPSITKDIAQCYTSVEKVMLQVQRDVTSGHNDEEILQVIKGLKKLDNVLKLFAAEGNHDLR